MNNLEKDLWDAMGNYLPHEEEVQAAASVAMKWIEKAFAAGSNRGIHIEQMDHKGYSEMDALPYNDWLIFKGLTPTEPDTKEPVVGSNGIVNWRL